MVVSELHLYQTIVQVDKTIVLPRKHAAGSIPDYIFLYLPLVDIFFEILKIAWYCWSAFCKEEIFYLPSLFLS